MLTTSVAAQLPPTAWIARSPTNAAATTVTSCLNRRMTSPSLGAAAGPAAREGRYGRAHLCHVPTRWTLARSSHGGPTACTDAPAALMRVQLERVPCLRASVDHAGFPRPEPAGLGIRRRRGPERRPRPCRRPT